MERCTVFGGDSAKPFPHKPFSNRKRGRTRGLLFLGVCLLGLFFISPNSNFREEQRVAQAATLDGLDHDERVVCVLREEYRAIAKEIISSERSSLKESKDCLDLLPAYLFAANDSKPSHFEKELAALLVGTPAEHMAHSISQFDRVVAAFLVGIAKKESDWGRHVPTLHGQDCFNYWGYKGKGSRGTGMGYACFGTPAEAVTVVGSRIQHFVHTTKRDTPSEMVIWKCGSSCDWDNPVNVKKWISDVSVYYYKIAKKENAG